MIRTRATVAELEKLKQVVLRQIHKGFEGKTRVRITQMTGLADSQISLLKTGKIEDMRLDWLLTITIVFGFKAQIGFKQ